MKYAVVQTGGKQYKVTEGSLIEVERLSAEEGSAFTFDSVLFVADEGAFTLGQPLVSGISVTGKILEHIKGEKIRVANFKAKARYRSVQGHRQHLTKVLVESIGTGKTGAKKEVKSEKVETSSKK